MNEVSRKEYPCCLTIAGSDCGGNAGVQADLRAFHAYNVHGCTVFAAMTAQNPFTVSAIHPLPAEFVAAQLDAVLGVYSIRALKTGMLADPAAIEVIADRLSRHPEIAKVIDPVMIATSGARLVDDVTMKTIRERLLPLATLMTPNLPEAEALADEKCQDTRELARKLHRQYGCAVLIKGGHVNESDANATRHTAVDVLCRTAPDGQIELREFSAPWVENPVSTHGTGCSLAAAIAAELALGHDLADAIAGAKDFVHRAIAGSRWVGPNCGVLGFGK